MPFYIGDYLADTIGLTYDQHGRYLMAIMSYWRKRGPLSEREAKSIFGGEFDLLTGFFTLKNGVYHHKRIDRELSSLEDRLQRNKARTEAATLARKQRNDGRNDNVTSNVTSTYLQSQSPSYKAYKGKATKPTKLSKSNGEVSGRFEAALDSEWVNDAGKWVNRIKSKPSKCIRVIAEVENATKEGRVKTTPAAYAEHIWKEFK